MSTTPAPVTPGLVVTLDTAALRTRGDCLTNAEAGPQGDRAVTGVHDFLVVYVDGASGLATAVPLFGKSAVGNQPLVEELKSGGGSGWIGTDHYFSRWQHWRMPVDVIRDAAAGSTGEPRRYAAGDSSVLDDIRIWEGRNRAPYRPA